MDLFEDYRLHVAEGIRNYGKLDRDEAPASVVAEH